MAAIDALNGTMFKGRQLAVELSKAQPLINQIASGNSGNPTTGGNDKSILSMQLHVESSMQPCSHNIFCSFDLAGGREGLLPRPPPSLEHHQSQAAVLAAAAAAAAGLPIQVSLLPLS